MSLLQLKIYPIFWSNFIPRISSPLTATPPRSLRKDPGCDRSRGSQILGGIKKSIGGRVRRNSLSHKKASSKKIFPFLAQSSTVRQREMSTWNGNRPVINICIYRKYRITKCQVTNVNMCPGVLLFRLSDGDKRDTEDIF